MATVDKAFRVKNGLAVEGSATVNNSTVLTESSTEFLQDTVGGMVSGGTQTNITVTYDDETGKLSFVAENGVADSTTSDLAEGTNLYFTDERAQDAAASMITAGTHTNISVSYDDNGNKLSFTGASQYTDEMAQDAVNTALVAGTGISKTYDDNANTITIANSGVTALAGTANQIAASASSGSVTLSLPAAVTFPGSVTLNADPTQPLHAATKQYVDSVAEGLHVHASVAAATTANIADLSDPPATIDGVTLTDGMRVLVKNQTSAGQNGIYVYDLATTALVRAEDYNTAGEIDAGDFVFVTGGNTYDNTGWVQENAVTTLGTDPIAWTQFSGAGTYTNGNGLTLTGTVFAIDTAVTVDVSSIQTLSNKTLTAPTVNGLVISDGSVVVEGSTANEFETTLQFTDPTADRTITFKDGTGTVAFVSDIPTTSDGLSEGSTNLFYTAERVQDEINSTIVDGTGLDKVYNDGAGTLTLSIDSTVTTNSGEQTLTNKTIALGSNSVSGTISAFNSALTDADFATTAGIETLSNKTLTSPVVTGLVLNDSSIVFEGSTANEFETTLTVTDPTSDHTITLPNATGTVITTGNLSEISSIGTVSEVNLTDAKIDSTTITATTSGVAATIDSFAVATFSTAKYIIQMKNSAGDREVVELLVTVDGNNNVYLTEYANIVTNASLGETNAVYNSGNVDVQITPAANNIVVKATRTLLEA